MRHLFRVQSNEVFFTIIIMVLCWIRFGTHCASRTRCVGTGVPTTSLPPRPNTGTPSQRDYTRCARSVTEGDTRGELKRRRISPGTKSFWSDSEIVNNRLKCSGDGQTHTYIYIRARGRSAKE